MTDICLSTTCDDSQIPVSCPPPHCDTLQCICIPIVTVESELGRIAREYVLVVDYLMFEGNMQEQMKEWRTPQIRSKIRNINLS